MRRGKAIIGAQRLGDKRRFRIARIPVSHARRRSSARLVQGRHSIDAR